MAGPLGPAMITAAHSGRMSFFGGGEGIRTPASRLTTY